MKTLSLSGEAIHIYYQSGWGIRITVTKCYQTTEGEASHFDFRQQGGFNKMTRSWPLLVEKRVGNSISARQ